MVIGIPQEIKQDEYRVALLPVGVELLRKDGHRVLLQKGAGLGSGYADAVYADAGAEFVETAAKLYEQAEMIVKVKEPQPEEIACFRSGQIVFCFFHFASSRALTEACLQRGIAAVAYETLADQQGRLPLLTPMSEVAGKMAIQQGAKCLERPMGGSGLLLGGVPGVAPAHVLIIGGGVVGANAARVAAGFGANVVIMDINAERLRYLETIMPANVCTVYSDPHTIREHARIADLVVGAVLVPGEKAPVLIDRSLLQVMQKGSVLVDVCIDQGGCCITSRPTTHSDPVFIEEDVVHYCVANIPGAVSRTSTKALCNATLPYCRELAKVGLDPFVKRSPGRAAALNMRDGKLLCPAVAKTFPDLPHV
ncbi:MAG: alanine dehydrogenase [Candidatus Electrothrix sp. GW3-4]|uniref:alanine dehydrogenase n=1 Tax=Candidatus Electrothrix sp. GW3-4 TaxID=3126740 RepID=UPI0030D09505